MIVIPKRTGGDPDFGSPLCISARILGRNALFARRGPPRHASPSTASTPLAVPAVTPFGPNFRELGRAPSRVDGESPPGSLALIGETSSLDAPESVPAEPSVRSADPCQSLGARYLAMEVQVGYRPKSIESSDV